MIRLTEISIYGIHGMDATYRLADKTAFSGSNGVGKSTVLKSIQWALLGYIPGTNRTNTALFQHAVGNRMSVKLTLDVDGQSVSIFRQLIRSGSSIVSTFEVTPTEYTELIEDAIKRIELPSFNFNEFAGMTANKLKDWFIEYLPKSEVSVDWHTFIVSTVVDAGLPPLPKNIADELLVSIRDLTNTYSGVDLIRKVNDLLKMRVSATNAESKRIASTLQSLVRYDGDDELSVVTTKAALRQAELNRNRLEAYYRDKQHNLEIEAKLQELNVPADTFADDPEFKDIIKQRDSAQEHHALLQKARDVLTTTGRALADKERELRQFIHGTCPMFPDVACEHLKQAKENADAQLIDLRKEQDALYANLESNATDSAYYASILDELKTRIAQLGHRYTLKANLISTLRPISEVSDIVPQSIEFWTDEVYRLNRLIGQLENNELFSRLQTDKFNIDNQLAAYKVLEKATGVNGLQTKLDSPFARLVSMMNDDIHALTYDETCNAEFILSDKANSFSFGLNRGGLYIPYDMLSSGEKTLYCLALLASLCRVNTDIRLMLIDDLFDHLDTTNYMKAVQWMTDVTDIQFIVAGVSDWTSTAFLTHAVYNYIAR